jgi:hypothetical protein
MHRLKKELRVVGAQFTDPEGNLAVVVKGPVLFSEEIYEEMEADWGSYAGICDEENWKDGNWFYTKVLTEGYREGDCVWWNEAEIFYDRD